MHRLTSKTLDAILSIAAMGLVDNHTALTIGQLEASYPLYCKALRILIREQKTMRQIQRSVCWHRLEQLHQCLPRHYKDPQLLYLHLKRELCP